jgi:hypothetical protein
MQRLHNLLERIPKAVKMQRRYQFVLQRAEVPVRKLCGEGRGLSIAEQAHLAVLAHERHSAYLERCRVTMIAHLRLWARRRARAIRARVRDAAVRQIKDFLFDCYSLPYSDFIKVRFLLAPATARPTFDHVALRSS